MKLAPKLSILKNKVMVFLRRLKRSKAGDLAPAAVALMVVMLAGHAEASAFGAVTTAICAVAAALSGPIGLAIGVVMLAGGGIAVAAGGKRALGTVAWGVAGTAIAVSAVALTSMFFGSSGC